MVTLALKTIHIFDLKEMEMLIVMFIESEVLNYLEDDNPSIRREAMMTCCKITFPKNNAAAKTKLPAHLEKIINKLLHKFFVTATTDNEWNIRYTMLRHLNT